MKYKLYTTSIRSWEAMIEAIESAEKSIYIEMYIFLDDMSESYDFIGKLIQKAKDGVQVIIVADAFGSNNLKKETVSSIREAGVELLFFSDWLRRIHRKILIVDENMAFIGGVNIGKQFAQWNDMSMRLAGMIVRGVLRSFAYTYEMSGGKDRKVLDFRKSTITRKLRFWMFDHRSISGVYALKDQYARKLSEAKKNIRIVTPYFIPPRWFVALLDSAVHRGVNVEIIIPEKTEHPFIDRISHRFMSNIASIGVRLFLSKNMNHAKILVIDDQEGLVGSQNIDYLSFHMNLESGIFFSQKDAISELLAIFEQWKEETVDFKDYALKMGFIDHLINIFFYLWTPFRK